jgi:uncharacterized membrane protein YdbT with pleckstrin-like domain
MSYVGSILGKNERIVFVTRQHWLVIAGSLLVTILASALIVGLAIAASLVIGGAGLLALVLLILPLGRGLLTWLRWWNEQYLITNRRIIQVEGVINKNVIDSSLEKVNDVVMSQSVLGRLLGYGDIEILTASDVGVNKLTKIADPIRFKTTMMDQKEALMETEAVNARVDRVLAEGPRPTASEDIPEIIAELAQLRDKGLITEQEFQDKKAELMKRI